MKPAVFDYCRPASVRQALQLLSQHREAARLMAGGQSLVPMLNLRVARPGIVIDLGAIAELRGWKEHESGITLGALVTHAQVEDGKLPDAAAGYLPAVASGIAYRAVRNRGTMAGSLAHADPLADWPTALMALDAQVSVIGPNGQRRVDLRDFLQGPFSTDLAEDELIAAVEIGRHPPSLRWGYAKQARKVGEFAESIVAAAWEPSSGFARVAIGGLAGMPVRLEQAAQALAQGRATEMNDEDLLAWSIRQIDESGHKTDAHKRLIHGSTLCRALRQAAAGRSR